MNIKTDADLDVDTVFAGSVMFYENCGRKDWTLYSAFQAHERGQTLSLIHIYKRNPVSENDIPDIIERFHNKEKEVDRKRTEKSFFVPKQEIVDNDYDLSVNKYKKIEYVPVEYPPTAEIMNDIFELEAQIGKELRELKEMLEL